MTHKMPLCSLKNKTSQIKGTSFAPKKNRNTFFAVIATKPVDIMFKQTIDNIKEVNWNYVIMW